MNVIVHKLSQTCLTKSGTGQIYDGTGYVPFVFVEQNTKSIRSQFVTLKVRREQAKLFAKSKSDKCVKSS
jgi:hypothetical protein